MTFRGYPPANVGGVTQNLFFVLDHSDGLVYLDLTSDGQGPALYTRSAGSGAVAGSGSTRTPVSLDDYYRTVTAKAAAVQTAGLPTATPPLRYW